MPVQIGPHLRATIPMMNALALAGSAGVAAAASVWKRRHDRSPAVRQWQPSTLPGRRVGSLHVRTGGAQGPVVVLLHGLVATGDIFGAAFDTLSEQATLVVPDLLGFGRSLDEARSTFTIEDHLDALDAALDELGVGEHPIVIGSHSMGAAVAVAWAARRGRQVRAVLCWGPPVYSDASDVDAALADTGLMARLFAGSDRVARAACRLNCTNRRLAGWFAAAVTPALPIPIARKASLHTWPAYRDAVEDVVAGTNWTDLAQALAKTNTAVTMTWGDNDPIGDRSVARSLAGVDLHAVADADHHLPLTHSGVCIDQLRAALESASRETP